MGGGRVRRSIIGLGLPLAAFIVTSTATAQMKPLGSQVKAAFLQKFAAYVNWPPGALGAADDPIQLCVLGRDPFGSEIDAAVASQRIDQHPFVVRRLDSTVNAARCNIAFLGGSARQSPAAMQDALRGKPILTVTDDDLGAERGIVHFVLKDGRVRFLIDDALAARDNLGISARLLALAISVKPRARIS